MTGIAGCCARAASGHAAAAPPRRREELTSLHIRTQAQGQHPNASNERFDRG